MPVICPYPEAVIQRTVQTICNIFANIFINTVVWNFTEKTERLIISLVHSIYSQTELRREWFPQTHSIWSHTYKGKGKAVPLQTWSGPDGSRKLGLPVFVILVPISVRGWVEPQGHSAIGRILFQRKISLTPAGIEPATFRFVPQNLNHCAIAVPRSHTYIFRNFITFYCLCRSSERPLNDCPKWQLIQSRSVIRRLHILNQRQS